MLLLMVILLLSSDKKMNTKTNINLTTIFWKKVTRLILSKIFIAFVLKSKSKEGFSN
jgi:hypothetical protein